MQAHLRFLLGAPIHYWRTLLLVPAVALFIGAAFADGTAVLLASLACAFVFRNYECRRWIDRPDELVSGDILFRVSLVLLVSYLGQQAGT